ncbi:MAG: ABC transporter permease, partial [Parasporobacterium sp.]|nr:ABC transporter permease [Parasporobacterium sp.]
AQDFRVSMEGTLMGSFALACVCIWNGCFNSIQVICRERDVIKREHRSGMHISSYIAAHMMYQLILCIMQVVVSLVMTSLVGMNLHGPGLLTRWMIVDAGLAMLLITYAADMMSLWISTLCHSTTTAMTIMPFVLIFQLVFSGSLIPIPSYVQPISNLTISYPGINSLCALTGVNSLPAGMVSDMVGILDDASIEGRVTVGQVLEVCTNEDNKTIAGLRAVYIGNVTTVKEAIDSLANKDDYEVLRSTTLIEGITVGKILEALNDVELPEEIAGLEIGFVQNVGEAVDFLASNEIVKKYWDEGVDIRTTVGDIIDMVGRDDIQKLIDEKAMKAYYSPSFESSISNVLATWGHVLIFIALFSVLSVITLEFIDKDKR